MLNEDYHSAPGVSKSHLDAIADRSPMHYHYDYLTPKQKEEKSDALVAGDAIHKAILEPELFERHFIIEPKVDKRTKIGKETYAAFELANAGKNFLSADNYTICAHVRDAAHAHPVASGLLAEGTAEDSFFAIDPETEELVKCRTDWIVTGGDMVVDIKSATDASPIGFGKAAANFRYDLQPAWYFDVMEYAGEARPSQFIWIAFEKEPPYAIGVYYATPEQIERARVIARQNFNRILHYRRLNAWPDYGDQIMALQLPGWARR